MSLIPTALENCQKSLEITRQTGDKKGQANLLFHLGQIYFTSGQYYEALDFWHQSLQIRIDIDDKKGQAEVLYCLGRLYANQNWLEGNYEKAILYLEKGLTLGRQTEANDILAKIYFEFYSVLKKLKLYEEAIFRLEEYLSCEKILHREALSQKITNSRITHQVEQA